jgi:26S proteasome regulatory subunit N11
LDKIQDHADSGHDACYGLQEMLNLAQQYNKSIVEESTLSAEELKIRHVGKQDPKRHLGDAVEKAMGQQVVQGLGMGVLSEVSVSTVSGRGMAVDRS